VTIKKTKGLDLKIDLSELDKRRPQA